MRATGTAAALASGGLLAIMTQLNGELALHTGSFLASWVAHVLGAGVAGLALALLPQLRPKPLRDAAPVWAYAGGLAGAATVMMTAAAVNTPLALAGTLSLGLMGQALFSLAADKFGLFGLPRRCITARDLASLGLILAGSLVILVGAEAAS